MKKPCVPLTLVMLAVLALGLAHPARVLADDDQDDGWMKTEQIYPFFDTNIINGCSNGESVHIVGHGVVVIKTRVNADGTLQLKERDAFTGEGTSTSGAQYTLNEDAHFSESIGPNPDGTPFSFTQRSKQTLHGVGGIPDQRITFDIELVIDGAGNVTVDIFNFNLDCN
jgi:hypothetical protein